MKRPATAREVVAAAGKQADPDCPFAALYNYDTVKGQPEIKRAMLDAMKMAAN